MAKKSRWLLQTLILSVILNCALVALFFYFMVRDNPQQFSFRPLNETVEEFPPVDKTFISKMQSMPFERLVALLLEKRVVLAGWRMQDLALSALVCFHHVDIHRALNQKTLSKRKWLFDKVSFDLFPGLNENDFQKIKNFIESEKWPFTIQGLVKLIEGKDLKECDRELLTFFCHTPEMVALQTLFARAGRPVQRGVVLKMVQEGGAERLSNYYLEQEKGADFSAKRRQSLLLDYMKGGSKTAACLLLLTDPIFAEHGLSDEQISQLLVLLADKASEVRTFLQKIAHSPRSEKVRSQAVQLLSNQSSEQEIAGRFVPRPGAGQLRPVFREEPPRSPAPSMHVVQPGESLWQLAKKYQVSIEELMAVNHLQSTVIRSGKTLKIPHP